MGLRGIISCSRITSPAKRQRFSSKASLDEKHWCGTCYHQLEVYVLLKQLAQRKPGWDDHGSYYNPRKEQKDGKQVAKNNKLKAGSEVQIKNIELEPAGTVNQLS